MRKINLKKRIVVEVLNILVICLIGLTGIVFVTLYFNIFNKGYMAEMSVAFTAICVGIISSLTVLTILFYKLSNGIVYKIFYLTITFIAIIILVIYALQRTGIWTKINDIEDFRRYILNFGSFAIILFIVIQFLQVVVLPIPSFITVGAGVLMFGPFYSAIYSCVGIILGSIIAYFVGKKLGVSVVKWLIGETALNKWLGFIKNKDKFILTYMFLFPFFPDDILCFVAGITTISPTFFLVMITFTRIVSIFVSCYSINNSIIPYNTWWGILLWILIVILTIVVAFFVCKKGENIRGFIKRKITCKNIDKN